MFNIYSTKLSQNLSSSDFTTVNYVDDFQLAISGPIANIEILKTKTADALSKINSSASNIDLILNTSKTNYLTISSRSQLKKIVSSNNIDFPSTNNQINTINRVKEQKNLGVWFDDHLSFDSHHTQTLKTCYGTLHSLKHLKHRLSTKNKRILINSLILSKMYYGNLITHPLNSHWTAKYNTLFKTCLSFIHNRYIRSIEMNSLNFLNPHNTWKYNILTHTFKAIFHNNFPTHLKFSLKTSSSFR